ncbi:MAG: hypothetical protein J2P15_04905 [Micromonosporaceae bacterium]|nr:hypothetical protein [Micromonosporaceae bacterium]
MSDGPDAMVVLGEVHTGLLQNSTPLPPVATEQLLSLLQGERVRRGERPIAHATSPDLLTGVDTRLATATGTKVRGVGTVATRAALTGGHVLQASSVTRLARAGVARRLPWSHYLARPGYIEVSGRATALDLADAFTSAQPAAGAGRAGQDQDAVLDLGAVSTRMVDAIQASPRIDRRPPLRAARTKLRWAAVVAQPPLASPLRLRLEPAALRTLRLVCGKDQIAGVADFCADLALHDWLLTTLLRLIERSRIGIETGDAVLDRLRPAVDHLLHLWMPAARLPAPVTPLWTVLEHTPGFTRQWQACVARIRDQMALRAITLLGAREQQA